MSRFCLSRQISGRLVAGVLGVGCSLCIAGAAQPVSVTTPTAVASASSLLPDAPSAVGSSSSLDVAEANSAPMLDLNARRKDSAAVPVSGMVEASRTQKLILATQTAPVLTTGDMVLLGVKDAFSLTAVAGWFVSAGYSQWMNSSPNYGTDGGAFAQRLGATALCNSSEDILSDSVMAPLLHEDPRYYRMGPGHNFFVRLVYAGTRPVITRTSGGRTTPNFAEIAGNAEGSALTNLYYPQVNTGMTQTMETLGLSIGGSAIGDVLSEFSGGVTRMFHGRQP